MIPQMDTYLASLIFISNSLIPMTKSGSNVTTVLIEMVLKTFFVKAMELGYPNHFQRVFVEVATHVFLSCVNIYHLTVIFTILRGGVAQYVALLKRNRKVASSMPTLDIKTPNLVRFLNWEMCCCVFGKNIFRQRIP